MTTTIADLTTATPVEIDTDLKRLYVERRRLSQQVEQAAEAVQRAAGAKVQWSYQGRRSVRSWSMTLDEAMKAAAATAADPAAYHFARKGAQEALDELAAARAAVAANEQAARPLNAEYQRRGKWTRAFLVITSGTGHVHSSMACSTCYPTTFFDWRPEFSGHDEAEIVEAAGERACTVCYPSAPVDVLARPSRIFSDEEREQVKAREVRAAEKAARLAKKIEKGLTEDGSEFVVTWIETGAGGHERDADGRSIYVYRDRERHESFKTEQAAMQWAVQTRSWGSLRGEGPAIEQVLAAVAAKHDRPIEEVRATFEKKVAAKVQRDSKW